MDRSLNFPSLGKTCLKHIPWRSSGSPSQRGFGGSIANQFLPIPAHPLLPFCLLGSMRPYALGTVLWGTHTRTFTLNCFSLGCYTCYYFYKHTPSFPVPSFIPRLLGALNPLNCILCIDYFSPIFFLPEISLKSFLGECLTSIFQLTNFHFACSS